MPTYKITAREVRINEYVVNGNNEDDAITQMNLGASEPELVEFVDSDIISVEEVK